MASFCVKCYFCVSEAIYFKTSVETVVFEGAAPPPGPVLATVFALNSFNLNVVQSIIMHAKRENDDLVTSTKQCASFEIHTKYATLRFTLQESI